MPATSRTLTPDEVVIVKRWGRKSRIMFWVLMPLVAPTVVLMAVIPVIDLFGPNPSVWGDLIAVIGSVLTTVYFVWLWRYSGRYRAVDARTLVSEIRGVFRVRLQGKTHDLYIGETCVMVASKEIRRQLVEGKHYTVDVIWDAPILVVNVQPEHHEKKHHEHRRS